VDTISLDPGNSSTFPVHVNFLATDRYGLEGMNNLDRIPPRGALAYVGLMPWEEGSGTPAGDRELVGAPPRLTSPLVTGLEQPCRLLT
jgi:kynurenine formamidase